MRGHGRHRLLARRATFLGTGSVAGRLLNLGRYPGLIRGTGRVKGERYNFLRSITIVTLARGRRARAWVYRYRGPRERAVPVPHGDYRRI